MLSGVYGDLMGYNRITWCLAAEIHHLKMLAPLKDPFWKNSQPHLHQEDDMKPTKIHLSKHWGQQKNVSISGFFSTSKDYMFHPVYRDSWESTDIF